jgi:hypothetical protein
VNVTEISFRVRVYDEYIKFLFFVHGPFHWESTVCTKVLEKAFYAAFSFVAPTGKKFCLAVDVSGSMRQPVIGASSIEARDASAAMMLLTAKTEKEFEVVAFSEGLKELNVNREDTLEDCPSEFSLVTMPYFILLPSDKDSKWMNMGSL